MTHATFRRGEVTGEGVLALGGSSSDSDSSDDSSLSSESLSIFLLPFGPAAKCGTLPCLVASRAALS